jgi:hypothetical protein
LQHHVGTSNRAIIGRSHPRRAFNTHHHFLFGSETLDFSLTNRHQVLSLDVSPIISRTLTLGGRMLAVELCTPRCLYQGFAVRLSGFGLAWAWSWRGPSCCEPVRKGDGDGYKRVSCSGYQQPATVPSMCICMWVQYLLWSTTTEHKNKIRELLRDTSLVMNGTMLCRKKSNFIDASARIQTKLDRPLQ